MSTQLTGTQQQNWSNSDHPLAAFFSAEEDLPRLEEPIAVEENRQGASHVAIWILGILVAGASAFLVWQFRERPVVAAAASADAGVVKIESTPDGALVSIDGREVGRTPWSSELKPGDYALAVTLGDATHRVPLNVPSGRSVQRVYFNRAESEATAAHDAAPVISQPAATVAPQTSNLAGLATTASAAGGWISVSAPIDLKLFENGTLIGSTKSDRIMLPVGRHVITVSDPAVGFETTTTLQVTAGTLVRAKIAVPSAQLNINAVPWADVTVDGQKLGSTPLANVSLPIGPHDILYSNPDLGVKRQTVVVSLNGPNRASADLNAR